VRDKKNLRTGYTTGACAAAAAKAATTLLLRNIAPSTPKGEGLCVEIPFPDGSRHKFRIQDSGYRIQDKTAFASVIKDAGDDPDVTNGAAIIATVQSSEKNLLTPHTLPLTIKGGEGVGIVTKPGLPVSVGEPAINPVPRRMIKEAVMELISECGLQNSEFRIPHLETTISVPDGERLAKKTLNYRLGIIGGISILGTTGIVSPISSESWTATINSSMDVARAMGHNEIVLSAGRTSEKAHMKKYNLPEECYVMMGDYLEYSLLEAKRHGFKKIHLCAQWAKMLKIAMATPQTHVKYGAIDIKMALKFLADIRYGSSLFKEVQNSSNSFNTAREIFDFINSELKTLNSKLFSGVCLAAKIYAEEIVGAIPVVTHLVSYDGELIASSLI